MFLATILAAILDCNVLTLVNTGYHILDIEYIKTDAQFVFIAYLRAEVWIFQCFGLHLELWNSYAIVATADEDLDIEYVKIGSSFAFVADL